MPKQPLGVQTPERLRVLYQLYQMMGQQIKTSPTGLYHSPSTTWLQGALGYLFGPGPISVNAADLKPFSDIEQPVNVLHPGVFHQLSADQQQRVNTHLFSAFRALVAAELQPEVMTQHLGGQQPVALHHTELGRQLQPIYTASQIKALQKNLTARGVFRLNFVPSSPFPLTTDAREHGFMSDKVWMTDSLALRPLIHIQAPERWLTMVERWAQFYQRPIEREALGRMIAEPDWYRKGGPNNGVAHVVYSTSMARDPGWLNYKRLDSHAMALQAFSQVLQQKALSPSSTLNPAGLEESPLVESTMQLATALKSVVTNPEGRVDYALGVSCGPWEEITLTGGLTSDVARLHDGFKALKRLLFDDQTAHTPLVQGLKQTISKDPKTQWLSTPEGLNQLIYSAQSFVRQRMTSPRGPIESPSRPLDAALVFVGKSGVRLSDDPIDNALRYFQAFAQLEQHLVRPHGMIRYEPFWIDRQGLRYRTHDTYLANGFWLPKGIQAKLSPNEHVQQVKSKSWMDEQAWFINRKGYSQEGQEAQWFMVSDLSSAYGVQVQRLQRYLDSGQCPPMMLGFARDLVQIGTLKQTEFLNRGLARLTGPMNGSSWSLVKANGYMAQPWGLPEAYEAVNTLSGKTTYLPGAHTTLAWAQASLFEALQLMHETLKPTETDKQTY